ncbi:hypothetical protein [Nocardia sp. SSK8]|uniref:hypothetical protein n=1 Tax=Nocardia sp. SSK8 TaxID=3120154 RepID=UPI003FA5C1D4
MLRLVIAAAVLGLVHLLLHRRLVRATGLSKRWAVAADGVLVAGWMLAIAGTLVGAEISPHPWRPLGFLGLTWLAVVFYLLLGLAVLGLVLLVLRLVGRFRGSPGEQARRGFLRIATAVVVVAAVATTAYGVVEAASPRVVHETVRTYPRRPDVAAAHHRRMGPRHRGHRPRHR